MGYVTWEPLLFAAFVPIAWWAWARAEARACQGGAAKLAGGETQRWLFKTGATHSLGRPDYLPLPLPMPAKQKGNAPANATSQANQTKQPFPFPLPVP